MGILIFGLLGLILLVFLVGLVLPSKRQFIKEGDIAAPVEEVFRMVTDVKNQTRWRHDVKEIRVLDDSTWQELPYKGSPLTFRIKKSVMNELFEIEIIEPKNFKGYWIGSFEPSATGTKVSFVEVVVVDNPFMRVLTSLFVDLDKTMELYLENLRKAIGNK